MTPDDLAPGDAKSLERNWCDIELHTIQSVNDPYFDMAFGALWAEFGEAGEVEQVSVLASRMERNPADMTNGCSLRYRLLLVTTGGAFVAVRDHTAIMLADTPGVVVHLSHNLVTPSWRRSGLAGWLRALPIQTARESLAATAQAEGAPIVLVGEMEHPCAENPATGIRLKAYEKAGYLKVDPSRVNYLQPDFRPPGEIDLSGGPRPLPLMLLIRRVGREDERTISGREVRTIAESLYHMYAEGFRPADMAPLFASLKDYPAADESIALLLPTA